MSEIAEILMKKAIQLSQAIIIKIPVKAKRLLILEKL